MGQLDSYFAARQTYEYIRINKIYLRQSHLHHFLSGVRRSNELISEQNTKFIVFAKRLCGRIKLCIYSAKALLFSSLRYSY